MQPPQKKVDFRYFLRLLARFQSSKETDRHSPNANNICSTTEKIKFAFLMYDLDGDGCISKEELLAVLSMMVGTNVTSGQLLSIADRMLLETDLDKDGLISFAEFQGSLDKQNVGKEMSLRCLK